MTESLVKTFSTSYDNLVAGSAEIQTMPVTLKSGRAYLCGSVIALATADSKGVLVDSSKTDGTQNPFGILTDDVDATTADVQAVVYVAGEFNGAALVFGGTDTLDKHKQALRNIGLIIRKTKKA